MDFAGRTVVVKGAASGIGAATARAFADAGASMVRTGRNVEAGSKTVDVARAPGTQARFVQADLAGTGGVARVILFPASARAAFVTGTEVSADGGTSARGP